MCDQSDQIDMEKRPQNRTIKQGLCHKCKEREPTTNVRIPLCNECLINTVVHRFRTNMMKLQTIEKECKVLVACSGGPSSIALLSLMNQFCKIDPSQQMRKPKFPEIVCVHVDQSIVFNNSDLEQNVRKCCQDENINYETIKIEQIFNESKSKMYKSGGETVVCHEKGSNADIFKETLQSLNDYSSKEDLIQIYTQKALEIEAKRLKRCLEDYEDFDIDD